MRWTWELPVAVAQFFTSTFTWKSAALSFAMTRSFPGAVIFTVGRGAAGSGLGVPGTSVGGVVATGAGAPASSTGAGSGTVALIGGAGGGGGGGGRFDSAPPQATMIAGRAIAPKRNGTKVVDRI